MEDSLHVSSESSGSLLHGLIICKDVYIFIVYIFCLFIQKQLEMVEDIT